MKLLEYIKGNRRGKDAHHVERLAMDDPFLADALEGLDSVEGDHAKQIEALQKQFTKKLKPKTYYFRVWSIAASILICVSVGGYYLFQNIHKLDQFAIKTNTEESSNLSEIQEIAYNDATDTMFIYMPEREIQKVKTYREREDLPMIDNMPMEKLPVSINSISIVSEVNSKSEELSSPLFTAMNDERSQKQSEVEVASSSNKRGQPSANQEIRIRGLGGALAESSSKERPKDNIKPSPLMGMKAYQNYIKDNMKRPTDAVCGDMKGTVVLEFYVDTKGTPINISVKKGVCVSIDLEAIRLLQQGPKWTVGSQITELKIKF